MEHYRITYVNSQGEKHSVLALANSLSEAMDCFDSNKRFLRVREVVSVTEEPNTHEPTMEDGKWKYNLVNL